MHSKLSLSAAILIVFVAATFGQSPAYAAPLDNACSLLAAPQVRAALNVMVGPGQPVFPDMPGRPISTVSNICDWSENGAAAPAARRVVLTVTSLQSFTNGKAPASGFIKEPATGVGDNAYFIATPGFGTSLNAQKADYAISLRVYGFSVNEIKVIERTLARQVFAKI